MSSSPSAAQMGKYCSELDVGKAIKAMEESFENLQRLDRVNINSMKKLFDEHDELSQSNNDEFDKLTYNAIEEMKKISDKNAEESIRKLAEDRKKQEKKLERRISELRKELDATELEMVEQNKGAINIIKLMKESEQIKALRKIKDLDEECNYLKELSQTLNLKEGKRDEELHEARKALLENAFADIPGSIDDIACSKNIGELNFTTFMKAMEIKYNCEKEVDAFYLANPVYELWEKYLQSPDWHPLKVVNVDGQPKEIIDEEDERLKSLKNDYGQELYDAVTTALTERMQYNPVKRCAAKVLWNYKQNRLATVGEGVAQLLDFWDYEPEVDLSSD